MSTDSLSSPNRAPVRVPRLKYRHETPVPDRAESAIEGKAPVREPPSDPGEIPPAPESKFGHRPRGPSIREIRQSIAQASSSSTAAVPSSPTVASGAGADAGTRSGTTTPRSHSSGKTKGQAPRPAKKKSRFKSFFSVREPSLLALSQVEAQLIAQHGSASATKVPHVRMEKMPDYVPKVNSKWDGIPEQMKAKQKLEKEKQKQKQKARKRASLMSQSTDSSSQRRTDWSGSHTPNSMVSRSKSTASRRSDLIKPNPHRFYATSCNSSGDLAAQRREDTAKDKHVDDRCKSPRPPQSPQSPQSPSFRPSSRRTVSESGSFYPPDIPANPSIPEKYRAQANPVPSLYAPCSPVTGTPAVEAIPDLTSSPVATSQERPMSPVARPGPPISDLSTGRSLDEALLQFEGKSQSQPRSNNQSATHQSSMKPDKLVSEGFLAGEAQEFTLPEVEDQPTSALPSPVHTWVNVRERAADKSHNHKQNPAPPATERVRPRWRTSLLLRTSVTLLEVPDGLRTPPLSSSGSTKDSLGPLTPRTFVTKSLAGSLRSFRS